MCFRLSADPTGVKGRGSPYGNISPLSLYHRLIFVYIPFLFFCFILGGSLNLLASLEVHFLHWLFIYIFIQFLPALVHHLAASSVKLSVFCCITFSNTKRALICQSFRYGVCSYFVKFTPSVTHLAKSLKTMTFIMVFPCFHFSENMKIWFSWSFSVPVWALMFD